MLCLHTLSLLSERSGTKFKEAKQNTLVHECRVCFSFHIGRFSLTNCQWVYIIFSPTPPVLDRKQHKNGLIYKAFRVYTHFRPPTPYLNKKSLATSCAQTQNATKLSTSVYIIKNANAAIPNITQRNPITTSIGLNIILTAIQ